MFDREQFIADCRVALAQDATHVAVREVVRRACADPAAVLRGLGEPGEGGITPIHHAPDLTILNVVWGRKMTLMPHNHRMWAVIGLYTGREDNIFWRRIPGSPMPETLEAAGARSLAAGETDALGREIIHSVTNPLNRLTGAIHVYGGDFFATERSQWNPETLTEEPYDIAQVRAEFANSRN
jgi:predicted metal-dependent enzyme (double-stranded beta helix superfamily)